MSDYKRLTKRDADSNLWTKCKECAIYDKCDFSYDVCCEELTDRLAELEDKLENGTLIELPCVREINSFLGKYEAVYFKGDFNTIQECVVGSIKEGWEIIAYYGNAHHKAIAEAKLEELKKGKE